MAGRKVRDLTNEKFGYLTPIRFIRKKVFYNENRKYRIKIYWECLCDCSETKWVEASNLISKNVVSCGCKRIAVLKEQRTTHGMSGASELTAYHEAKKRCTNKNNQRYKHYGGRGIKFLFDSFEEFYEHIGPKPSSDHSLDRINNDGHYEIGNVHWATSEEQNQNRSMTKLFAEAVRDIRANCTIHNINTFVRKYDVAKNTLLDVIHFRSWKNII